MVNKDRRARTDRQTERTDRQTDGIDFIWLVSTRLSGFAFENPKNKNPILPSHSFQKTQFYLVANRIELVTPLISDKSVTPRGRAPVGPVYRAATATEMKWRV